MIHAYDESYVSKGQTALGQMLRYAEEDLNYDLNDFYKKFLLSGVGDLFGRGDYRYLVGMSGIEMAYEVFRRLGEELPVKEPTFRAEKSPVYWTGWILAWYQWYTGQSFRLINEYLTPEDVLKMYYPYHEMDPLQFADAAEARRINAKMATRLRVYRERLGMSQRDLAAESGTSVRMIQHYEQRQKDINRAQTRTLYSLSRALHCTMEDLMEPM